ncbi:MAG TPA: TIGR01244 family sulfur transferase [Casimicrobiaceae bacterium]|nr:TIGR01244 family sulfur transferase [Casimicrobiaceae bacterium]
MALAFTWLSPDFATAGQIAADDVAQAAAAGFRSIVNNRPDFEGGPSQPTSDAIARAAKAAGLDYAFLPVQSGFQTPAEIAKMRELLDALPKPVLGFCRSGARTSNLYRAAKSR